MPTGLHAQTLRRDSKTKLDLDAVDANDTSAFEGTEQEAKAESKRLTQQLERLQEALFAEHKHKVLIVLQAMDGGGKDGVIRRVFEGVNPQSVKVARFRAPSQEEQDHDFLWRVHEKVPQKGEIVIFNRSHYEGVLVERVHGLVSKQVTKRRYREINDFERMLWEEGTTILKFYLHIDLSEQKKRMEERLKDPTKEWKFSSNDLMERALWPKYMKAYERAIGNTSTKWAPWFVVPANHNWFRDLVISHVIVDALDGLKMEYPKLDKRTRSMPIP